MSSFYYYKYIYLLNKVVRNVMHHINNSSILRTISSQHRTRKIFIFFSSCINTFSLRDYRSVYTKMDRKNTARQKISWYEDDDKQKLILALTQKMEEMWRKVSQIILSAAESFSPGSRLLGFSLKQKYLGIPHHYH